MILVVAIEGTSFLASRKDIFDFSWGLTYFLKLHIIIVQGGQRHCSVKR